MFSSALLHFLVPMLKTAFARCELHENRDNLDPVCLCISGHISEVIDVSVSFSRWVMNSLKEMNIPPPRTDNF